MQSQGGKARPPQSLGDAPRSGTAGGHTVNPARARVPTCPSSHAAPALDGLQVARCWAGAIGSAPLIHSLAVLDRAEAFTRP